MDTASDLRALFQEDSQPYTPYPYQTRTAETLLGGQNVILRAPTGAGKTEAALGPFLLARQQRRTDFPQRCIIASPMRTLAKDLHERAKKAAEPLGLSVKLHTGEDPTDSLLEADIIITTYDQLLSNYLHVPYSQSWRSRNIGAGGVVSSYVVLDEFHLFDPLRAFRTTLEMARALQGITPFLFMTATLSEHLTQKLAGAVGAEFVTPSADELATMQSQQKTRCIRCEKALLTAEAVAQAHQRRSIAIANTVDRVQTLYADLQRLKLEGGLPGTELTMLHSRYFPAHRNAHEIRLKAMLGKKSDRNVILVASQAVEVGIDISSEQLHTELCPANALLQRAGRNARYAGEHGVVSVYALPEKNGKPDVMPYKGQDEVIQATWDALADLPATATPAAEAHLIDRVHTAGDEANWDAYEKSRTTTLRSKMNEAFGGERSVRSDLIRDVQNVSVLMVKPGTDLSTWAEVNRHERLSVTRVDFAALEQNRRGLGLEHDFEENWLVKVPYEIEQERSVSEMRQPTLLGWKTISTPQQLNGQTLVLVNPAFVFYNREEGFRWQTPESSSLGMKLEDIPEPHDPRPTGEGGDYWYVYETYEEHIRRVLASAQKHAKDVWHICAKVDGKFDLPAGTTELAIKAAIAAHDIGKLSVGWQTWSRSWQAEQVRHYVGGLLWNGAEEAEAAQKTATVQGQGEFSAHTDHHPTYDRGRSKQHDKRVSRPPHAGESAAVFMIAFGEELRRRLGNTSARSVAYGVAGAVARHHSAAATGEIDAWKLDAGAEAEARRVFAAIAGAELDLTAMKNLQQVGVKAVLKPLPLSPTDPLGWLIYTLASRALRLGDTRSFEDVRSPAQEADS